MIAVTGPAGSGKTTYCEQFDKVYHIDSRFIGDSQHRVQLLNTKQGDAYADAANQFNWWDWDAIERDLREQQPEVVEGAFLGPPNLVALFERIIFLCVPASDRLARLTERDAVKRTPEQVRTRFALTEKAESDYYTQLRDWAKGRIEYVENY